MCIPGKFNLLAILSFYSLPELSSFRHLGLLVIIARYLIAFFGFKGLFYVQNTTIFYKYIKIYTCVILFYALVIILYKNTLDQSHYFLKTHFIYFPNQLIYLDFLILFFLIFVMFRYQEVVKLIKIKNLLIFLFIFCSIFSIFIQRDYLPNSSNGLIVLNNSLPLNFKNLRAIPSEDEDFKKYNSLLKVEKKDTSLSIPYINQSTFLKKTFCVESYRADIKSKFKYDNVNTFSSLENFGCNLPIFWLVHEKNKIKIPQSEINYYLNNSYENFDSNIIVEEDGHLFKIDIDNINSQMNITNYSYNHIIIDTNYSEDSRLFVLENHDTRRNFYLDNVLTKTYKINEAFQGINIPKGRHTISITYSKLNQQLAILFFLMNLIIIPLIFALIIVKKTKRKEPLLI